MSGQASDYDKLSAARALLDTGDWIHRKVNSPRGWTKTAEKELEGIIRRNLTVILGRKPTPEEVQAVGDDDPSALEALRAEPKDRAP